MNHPVRVLLVLPDTDASADNERVLQLHRDLSGEGVEVRTVAVGPGSRGGLDSVVPVLAPSPRSPSAVTQLRREQRWADLVACSGARTALIQALGGSRRRVPVVVMPRDEGAPLRDPTRSPRALRGATVVEGWPSPGEWAHLFTKQVAKHRGRSAQWPPRPEPGS